VRLEFLLEFEAVDIDSGAVFLREYEIEYGVPIAKDIFMKSHSFREAQLVKRLIVYLCAFVFH
jgi:hypothetical protein